MLITRKIELHITDSDADTRKEHWKFLRMLDSEIYRAANLIVTNFLFNNFYENRLIAQDGNLKNISDEIRKLYKKRKENAEKINELKEMKKLQYENVKKLYEGKSRDGAIYRLTSQNFSEIPSNVVSVLLMNITKTLKKEWNEVQRGERTIRTYKKGMPIPFGFIDTKKWFEKLGNEVYLNWWGGIKFHLFFGRDRSNNRLIVDRCLNGEYKYSDSSIQLKDRKIFLLLVIDIPESKAELDENISVGVDLGVSVPAYCALSYGLKRLAIGSKDDLLRIRLQFQSRKRRLQRNLKMTGGGQGRAKKLKALENASDKEKRYVSTYNHTISHNIVKFAKDNNAATIKLEMLEGFGEDERNKFILRNWSYFQLQKQIEYKAKIENIKVVFIDPYHTSQICAACGNYEEGQREKQAEFICKNKECKNFDEKVNADFNAALNIARSNKVVSSKEECEYFKREEI